MNTESKTDRITQLEIERDEAKVATDFANLRIEQLEAALSEEKRIVDRVWNALGISTYEQAKPLAIDEHVKSLLDRLQAVEAERDRYKAALVKVNEWYEGKHEYAVDFLEDIEEQVTEALQPAKAQ